jgi:D-aminopeptidase
MKLQHTCQHGTSRVYLQAPCAAVAGDAIGCTELTQHLDKIAQAPTRASTRCFVSVCLHFLDSHREILEHVGTAQTLSRRLPNGNLRAVNVDKLLS